MVFVTGDCHADWHRFSARIFQEQRCMTRDDFVIVCGDFGIWDDDNEERRQLDWLNDKPFTTLFVDGNHENFDRLYGDEFEVVDFHGGKAHRIRDNIYHLMRGHIFDLCGKSFFAFGGAASHDIQDGILDEDDFPSHREFLAEYCRMNNENKMFRVNHVSWWKQELPLDAEMEFARANLAAHGNKVDFIITHDCPEHIAVRLYAGDSDPNALTRFLDEVDASVQFEHWYFGHHHNDIDINLQKKYSMLYYRMERIV